MQVVYSIISLFESVVFSFPQPALSSHRHFLSLQEFLTCVHSNFCSCVCENSFVHLLSVDQSPGFQQLNLRPKQIGNNRYINPTIFNIICWVAGSLGQSSHQGSTGHHVRSGSPANFQMSGFRTSGFFTSRTPDPQKQKK